MYAGYLTVKLQKEKAKRSRGWASDVLRSCKQERMSDQRVFALVCMRRFVCTVWKGALHLIAIYGTSSAFNHQVIPPIVLLNIADDSELYIPLSLDRQ